MEEHIITRKPLHVLSLYRRLRILYNRIALFGTTKYYTDWFEYTFQTKLGPRNFTCSHFKEQQKDGTFIEYNDYYYLDGNKQIFRIKSNKDVLICDSEIPAMDMWLAIYEIEQITEKILEEQCLQLNELEQ